jgi:hypothetical protein
VQRMLLLIGPLEANKATHELAGWALRSNSEGSLCFDLSPTRLVKGRLFIIFYPFCSLLRFVML